MKRKLIEKDSLTTDEKRILAAYRAMNNSAQEMLLYFSIATAVDCPRRNAAPLRLIVGGVV